jgi:hypothetical protein
MSNFLDRVPNMLDRAIPGWGRLLLVVSAVLLAAAIFLPLWQIHLEAPQYPEGLDLYIHSYTLDAGNEGQDLNEINNLNHYIGMQPIEEEDFPEMTFIPFFLGGFALLALRAAFFGTVKSAVDTLVLFVYFGAFSMWRFYHQLYTYAHNLDPKAPMDIDPFTPTLIGWKQIANFTQYSFPREGSALLLGAVLCFGGAIWMGVRNNAAEDEEPSAPAEAEATAA